MTFSDTTSFLFAMLVASVFIVMVIFAGALTVSFLSGVGHIREERADGPALLETRGGGEIDEPADRS